METNENVENQEVLDNEVQDETTASGAVETETQNEGEENTKDWKAEALKYKAIADRYKKKISEQPEKKDTTAGDNKTNDVVDPEFKDELRLIARGVPEEEIDLLKTIARGKGISLTQAMKDETFELVKKAKEKETETKKSQLGASYSGVVETPSGDSMTDIQKKHQEMLRKYNTK